MLRRRVSSEYSRMGRPSMSTDPGAASARRGMSETRVDLPEPVGPTMARLLPAGILRLTLRKTVAPASTAEASGAMGNAALPAAGAGAGNAALPVAGAG